MSRVLVLLLLCAISVCPCQAQYEDEPTIYLQPHGPIPQVVLWRSTPVRRAVKRGAISTVVSDVVVNVVAICLGRRR